MGFIRLLILSLILSCTCSAQWAHYKPNEKPIKINRATDTEVIKSISQDLINAAASGNLNIISKYLSKDIDTSFVAPNDTSSVFTPCTSLDSLAITSNANTATLKCIVYDRATKSKKNETMVLRRTKGRWEIASSTFLIKIIKQINGRNLSNANSHALAGDTTGQNSINYNPGVSGVKKLSSNSKSNTKQNTVQSNSIILSNSALVQRPVWYTDEMTINKSITQQYLSCSLFSYPYDAKLVLMNGSGDLFSVATDNTWDRIIYGSKNGQWIKSYGNNPADQKLLWASSIGLDKFGNIFVLAGQFPNVNLYRLLYNESSANISFVQQVSMSQVLGAADMCLDDNLTPDDVSDDSFWIADKKGNSIQQYAWNGNLSGKYTKVINSSTGAETDFYHPTRIITYDNNGRAIALIDNDMNRVIVITQISSYQGDAIVGNYVSYPFQESVALNSLGFFDDFKNGLWVTDKLNGMFHIFDAVSSGGYLASVKYNPDGQLQWQSPKGIYSTVMSNSNGDYLDGMTLDQWDNTYGVNTYMAGTDFINPVVTSGIFMGSLPYVTISATILTHSSVATVLYREDGTFIENGPLGTPYDWPAGNQIANSVAPWDVTNGSNAIGKFRMRFSLTPRYNSDYNSQYQQQPLYKDVWFAMPVFGSMAGPSSGTYGNNLTWTTTLTYGSGDFSYTWYRQDAGSSVWNQVSSGSSSCTQTMNSCSFTIRCDVRDNFNGNVSSYTQFVQLTSTITTSGTLTSNEVWSGNITVTGNVTVPSGITLIIPSGVHVTVANAASLIVNGTLNIQGTSNSNAVLDFGSISLSPINGIFSYAGSHVNLSYAEIKNCAVGVWSSDAPLHIDHCNLHNMYKTVYFNNLNYNNYGSAITNSYLSNCTSEAVWLKYCLATLTNNKITNNSGEGVRLSSYSDATLNMNTIQNNHNGITLSSYCDAALSGHNLLANNAYDGIAGQMGAIITATQGYNTFKGNNSYNIELYMSSTAYAENNYWGVSQPDNNMFYTDGTSSIDYGLWLTSDPGTGSSLPKTTTQQTDLNSAISYLSQGQFEMAEKLFKKVINNKLNSQECVYALSGLAACYRQSGNNGFRTYLENELRPRLTNTKDDLYRHYLELDSHCLINNGQYDGAINIHKQLRDNYQLDLETRKELDFDDAMINLVYKSNKIEGKAKFDKIKTDYPDERTKHDIDIIMAAYNNRGYSLLKDAAPQNNSGKNTNNIESIPTEYGLGQNYPNPFNPTTVINYQIPNDGVVTLKVFDVLGKEIKTLVNEFKTQGAYSAVFDGSGLSSGVYFYQLRVFVPSGKSHDFISTKKMILTK